MYKQAYATSKIAPIGAAAKLFNPILTDSTLDVLGGVGQYTLPQRGAGMALGALAGSYLAGPNHRQSGSTIGAGAGYLGAMGLDNVIKDIRRYEINKAIQHGYDRHTITDSTINDLTAYMSSMFKDGKIRPDLKSNYSQAIDIFTSPAFTLGSNYHGAIYNQYPMLYNVANNEKTLDLVNKKLLAAGVPDLYRNKIVDSLANSSQLAKNNLTPEKTRLPIVLHELLERKSQLFDKKLFPAQFNASFTGKAFDTYGHRIGMGHNSMGVLGDEINLYSRILRPDELNFMDELRRSSGELPTLSTLRNLNNMYDAPISKNLTKWAPTTSEAIRRGIDTGELLNQAENALVNESNPTRYLGQAGSTLRRIESSAGNAVGDAVGELLNKAKKYLPKMLGRVA